MEPRQDRRNEIIAIIIIAAIVLIGIIYFFSHISSSNTLSNIASSTATGATTTSATSSTTSITVASVSSTTGYTIKIVPVGKAPAAPDYKASLACSAGIAADVCSSTQAQFSVAQAAIKTNPTDFNAWIALGVYREEAGDYVGAAVDWQYMSALYPNNIVSNANLADLYTNYLKDYPKAAAAYKAAIANNPTQVYLYQDLFQLYTVQYPQTSTIVVSILKQGITTNPKATELMVTLARYYKSTGDLVDAKAEYTAAITSAQNQGQTTLAAQIQTEEAGN